MKRKIKNNFKLKKNTMLLISNDIEKKSNRYELKNINQTNFLLSLLFL